MVKSSKIQNYKAHYNGILDPQKPHQIRVLFKLERRIYER